MRGQTPDPRSETPATGWSIGILIVGGVIALHLSLALLIGLSRHEPARADPVSVPTAQDCPTAADALASPDPSGAAANEGASPCVAPASPSPTAASSSGRPGY